MVTIACVNFKGGVGKTALATNLAAFCGRKGKKTLLIDLDPQTNASYSCLGVDGWQAHAADHGTIADLFGLNRYSSATGKSKGFREVVKQNVFLNVDLLPSHIDLFTVDMDLASATARERKLKNALDGHVDTYDVVICDCPPNLTLPTQNALAISSHFIIPVSPDFLSGIGVGLLESRVHSFAKELGHNLEMAGIVVTRVGRPAKHRSDSESDLRTKFGDKVFRSTIKERAAVAEVAELHKSIFDSDNQDAKNDFTSACTEILQKLGVL